MNTEEQLNWRRLYLLLVVELVVLTGLFWALSRWAR